MTDEQNLSKPKSPAVRIVAERPRRSSISGNESPMKKENDKKKDVTNLKNALEDARMIGSSLAKSFDLNSSDDKVRRSRSASISKWGHSVRDELEAEQQKGAVASNPSMLKKGAGSPRLQSKEAHHASASPNNPNEAPGAASTAEETPKRHAGSGKYHFVITSTVPVHSEEEKEFTLYLVNVTYPNGETQTILRRFKQFLALHNALSKVYSDLPPFPKKKIIGNLNPTHIAKRRIKLELYLQGISKLQGVADFLAFQTFLTGDSRDGPGARKQRKVESNNTNAPGTSPKDSGLSPGNIPRTDSGGSSNSNSAATTTDEDDEIMDERPKERERRILTEKRIKEVESSVRKIDEAICRLGNIDRAFESVKEKEDFVRVSDASKLVVMIGKQLEYEDTEPNFVSKELPKEVEESIQNPKIKSIRQKIVSAISELISKLNRMKERLVDIDTPPEKVKALQDLVTATDQLFDTYCVIKPQNGYRIEGGASLPNEIRDSAWPLFFKENEYWYQLYFFGQEHANYMGYDPQNSPIVASLKPDTLDNGKPAFRAIIRTKDGNNKYLIPAEKEYISNWREHYQEILEQMDPKLNDVDLFPLTQPGLQQQFLDYEKKDMRTTRKFKFGVLLCKKGQTVEEEMFCNTSGSEDYERFLTLLGDKIQLKGWTKFAGGLDCKENTTGTHSIFTTWNDYEIMFHVATMLPTEGNEQQVAKKRHLGNDIVLLVFQEEGSEAYLPSTVQSHYIQIVIVVRVLREGTNRPDKPVYYQVAVVNQPDVPQYGPMLRFPPLYPHGPEFRNWLLEKMVNGELAAYKSKLFIQQLRTTYKTMLNEMVEKLSVPKPEEQQKKREKRGLLPIFRKK
jgi:hypothetical protein